jgi:hypothetical protein
MPECSIGLHTDVGQNYHLARIPNNLGLFIALTGSFYKNKIQDID